VSLTWRLRKDSGDGRVYGADNEACRCERRLEESGTALPMGFDRDRLALGRRQRQRWRLEQFAALVVGGGF